MKTFRVDKAWARDQERMRRYRRRLVGCFAAWLPLIFAVFLLIYDSIGTRPLRLFFTREDNDQHHRLSDLVPAFRDISHDQWLDAWLFILPSCAAFGAIVMAIFWRCPDCRAFLHGWDRVPCRCPRCDAKLADR